MSSKIFNVGLIGYGASAKVFHIPLIEVIPELKLCAIVQRHPTQHNDVQIDHPNIKAYRSAIEIVTDQDIDVIVVTTTPSTHFELAKMSLEHGKHDIAHARLVLVEKPFVPTSKEADELIELAKKNQRLLTVYQNRRWDSDFRTVQKLLQNNALGRIIEFESHFDRYKPTTTGSKSWKTIQTPGGGAIYDLGTHLIDQAVVLFGLPKKITAFLGSQRAENPGEYEDACTVLLHYNGSMTTTIKATAISAETEQLRFWIRGDKGSYKKFHEDCQEAHLTSGMKPGDPDFGVEPAERHGTLTTLKDGKLNAEAYPTIKPVPYSTAYSQLAKALVGQGDVPVKPENASSVIRLIELAKQSSFEGKTLEVSE
ncbi:MAG: hypothetical protein Q9167_005469 [Letrouitia subvulpina]